MAKKQAGRNPLDNMSPEAKEYAGQEAEAAGEDQTWVQSVKGEKAKLRKPRKDKTGQKSDYHKGTTMLGVRVTDDLAARVRAEAAGAGQSVSAWLGDLIRNYLDG